jgi:hypothetical protein
MQNSPRRLLTIQVFAAACAGILVLCLADASTPFSRADDKPPAQRPQAKARITVSKKTTRIVEPLDRDGYVDYKAALNQRASQGVTPENNAGVLLVRALGVSGLDRFERAEFFKLLRIEPLPERGEYLTDFENFVKNERHLPWTKKEAADLERSCDGPWSRRDLPLVHDWLQANEQRLKTVVTATRRSRCYLPVVRPAGKTLLEMSVSGFEGERAASRLLLARAVLQLAEGKVKEAEQDLLACHRLGRLYGQAPLVSAVPVAIAIDEVAWHGDAALIEFGGLSSADALAYQQELRRLAPLPLMADAIDGSERFIFLDRVSQMAREQLAPSAALVLFGKASENPFAGWFDQYFLPRSAVHWDNALLFGNKQFDTAVAAARQPTALARRRALEQLKQEGSRLKSHAWGELGKAIAREDMGGFMGRLLSALLVRGLTFEAADQGETQEALGRLAFSVAAYGADHGTYPDSLSALVPKYANRVPSDPFTEQPLHYRREGAGFVLYSVGQNGVDDGGRTVDSQPPGDDLAVKISGGPRSKK